MHLCCEPSIFEAQCSNTQTDLGVQIYNLNKTNEIWRFLFSEIQWYTSVQVGIYPHLWVTRLCAVWNINILHKTNMLKQFTKTKQNNTTACTFCAIWSMLWNILIPTAHWHIEAETIWPPFCRWHIQMQIVEWKYMNFDWNFTEICS